MISCHLSAKPFFSSVQFLIITHINRRYKQKI